jgi:hypothetical protein
VGTKLGETIRGWKVLKRHPDRKNWIPIDEGWLSSWVHEQREAFKRNKLAED